MSSKKQKIGEFLPADQSKLDDPVSLIYQAGGDATLPALDQMVLSLT